MTRSKVVFWALAIAIATTTLLTSCSGPDEPSSPTPEPPETIASTGQHPKIASWLAKKAEIIASAKPYDLVMSGFFTPEEASAIRVQNPNARLLAGLSINWVWDNPDWQTFLTTVANYGKKERTEITEDMYLRKPDGSRCAFGWASYAPGQPEIYAMDPRNAEWVEFIAAFYGTLIDQPQHDGIIVDMVIETSLCREAITDTEWIEATRAIMARIQRMNETDKLVIFNSGRDLSEIDAFAEFMDGYLMENFMGNDLRSTFDEGLKAADSDYLVIYAVDTDNTGKQDLNKMRLGLTLSLLNDNTYFTYDFGPRDHGHAWWFPEYDIDLGNPLGKYYEKDAAYWREFKNGIVVSSPHSITPVSFDSEHTDVTTGERSTTFEIEKGDGRIYVKTSL